MSYDEAPPMLDGHAYLALGRDAWTAINNEIASYWESYGTFDANGLEQVLARLAEQAPAVMDGRLGEARARMSALLLRRGEPVSPESRELLERDAAQDQANAATGLTTRLIEIEHRRDLRMSPKEYSAWRRELNALDAEIDAMPSDVAERIRSEARETIANRH